jgi:uncharacterized protein with FMN-binding domain
MDKKIFAVIAILVIVSVAAGALILGNSTGEKDKSEEDNVTTQVPPAEVDTQNNSANTSVSEYKDGSYSAEGSYISPGGTDVIKVTLTLDEDLVTEVKVAPVEANGESRNYISLFSSGVSGVVVGENIDEINVGKINGSSLTSGGFNKALEEIKSQAKQ